MKPYVTYDDKTGMLTGAFIQAPPDLHLSCMIEVSPEVYAEWTKYRTNEAQDGVELLPVPPDPMPTVPEYVAAVQAMLDAKAKERMYDGILSACTYATSLNPKFQAEGQACVEWRDLVWAKCYELMDEVEAGTLPQPTIAGLLVMLPKMDWPE